MQSRSLSAIRLLIAIVLSLGLVIIPTTEAYAVPTLRDFYHGDGDGATAGSGETLIGQTFTATSDYSVTLVEFDIEEVRGNPGDVYVYLMETDSNGLPTGSYLATAMRSSYAEGWEDWTFTSSYTVISGELYALVISEPDADSENNMVSFVSDNDGGYDYGEWVFRYPDEDWQTSSSDMHFEVYGGPPDYYVDAANCPGPGNGSSADPFCKIQDAIDAATGTIITVLPGVYEEDLFINKPDLTIRSTEGKENTTIILQTHQHGIEVNGSASDLVFGGAAGEGFTIQSGTGTGQMICLANNPNPVTISHCDIDLTGNASQGIDCGAASLTDLTIDNCTFWMIEGGDVCVNGQNVHDSVISNCAFVGVGSGTSTGQGVMIWGCPDMSYINNTFEDIGTGISIWSNSAVGDIINNVIWECTFTGCNRGLWFGEGSANNVLIDGVDIVGNVFTQNATGIQIDNSDDIVNSGFFIMFNHFVDNEVLLTGLHNYKSQYVTAENNWWDDASGPSGAGPGTGDAVSSNVDYAPWLGAPLVLPGVHHEFLVCGHHVVYATAVAETIVDLYVSCLESETDIYIAKYQSQPFPPQTFNSVPLGKYIDIYFSDYKAVDWPITVKVSYTDGEARGFDENTLGLYYFEMERSFIRCGATGVDTENNLIWADVTEEEAGYGDERPFAPGGELLPPEQKPSEPGEPGEPVGGEVYPINKAALLAPWIALAIAIIAGGIILVRRRVHS